MSKERSCMERERGHIVIRSLHVYDSIWSLNTSLREICAKKRVSLLFDRYQHQSISLWREEQQISNQKETTTVYLVRQWISQWIERNVVRSLEENQMFDIPILSDHTNQVMLHIQLQYHSLYQLKLLAEEINCTKELFVAIYQPGKFCSSMPFCLYAIATLISANLSSTSSFVKNKAE